MQSALEGQDRVEDLTVFEAFQFGPHELTGHRSPCAVLSQRESAVLYAQCRQICQESFHGRIDAVVVGGAEEDDLAAAPYSVDQVRYICF